MSEKKLERAEKKIENKEEDISVKESENIEEIERLIKKLKLLFYKEAELLSHKDMAWKDKCEMCVKLVDEEDSVLKKVKDDANLISKLATNAAKLFKKEELDAYLLSRVRPEIDLGLTDAEKLYEARKLESEIERINFLIVYDLEVLLKDQGFRKKLYVKNIRIGSDMSRQDSVKSQYQRLVKSSRYLNEMFKYVLGEENLKKYVIMIESDIHTELEEQAD
ncbi:hypothetical protein KY348_04705 [Candidatus Woesearchaeota archaeon]|nr:hypothetical protein [Candidatus Woesearchaeota archaeon]